MTIEKVTWTDKVEVLADGHVQVREATIFKEDGVEVGAKRFHRKVIEPGDDISAEDDFVKEVISGNVHTTARVKAHKDKKKAIRDALKND